MAITKEYLTKLGIEADIADKIFAERGKEFEADKEKITKLSDELTKSKQTITDITAELQGLKDKNATAVDWEKKFNELQEKQKAAEEENAKKEQEAADRADFESVAVDGKGNALEWSHDAIKERYFKKYIEAKENKEFKGKTGADIFNLLTKDDAGAFKTVQPEVVLKGANPLGGNAQLTKEAFAKMSYNEKAELFKSNPDTYNNLKGE